MKYDPSVWKTSIVQYSAAAWVRRSIAPCMFVGQHAPIHVLVWPLPSSAELSGVGPGGNWCKFGPSLTNTGLQK